MVNAIGFDLDGTLFDDRQYVRAGLDAAASVFNTDYRIDVREELHSAYFEQGINERTFDHVLENHGLSDDIVPELIDAYHDTECVLEPYLETEPVLDQLSREYRLGLLTGGMNGRSKVRRLELESYFNVLIVTPELDLTKRKSEPFEVLFDELGAASGSIYVGDRPELDFVHPNLFGAMSIQVASSFHTDTPVENAVQPDHVIHRLDELLSLVASLDR